MKYKIKKIKISVKEGLFIKDIFKKHIFDF